MATLNGGKKMNSYLQNQMWDVQAGTADRNQSIETFLKRVILKAFKEVKKLAQKQVTCKRKSCGCVILEIDLKQQLIQHYTDVNGASGPKNKCSNIKGACGCSHSEPRAIMKYLKRRRLKIKSAHIKTILLTTFSSCVNCANIIIDSKVIDAVSYEFLAKHWAIPPQDAKSMLDRSLLHFSKRKLMADKDNKLLRKLLFGK